MQTFKIAKKPIPLKPSPPASTHQLSYNQYQNHKMKQQLQIAKHDTLLKKIEELHTELYEKQSIMKEIKQTHLKQLFLVQVQLQHQMEITARYDAEFKKCQASRNQMQTYFQMKLELIKKEMTQAFENEILAERERAAEDLRLIKENYCTKIALIGEGYKERQYEFTENQHKSSNYELKINLIQSKLSQKIKALQIQSQKLLLIEEKNKEYQVANIQLKKKISQSQEQYLKKNQSLRQKVLEQQKLKDELYERFKAMKIQIENSQIKKQQLEKINLNLKNQLELALRKYNYIQKELDQLNRKTYKNKQDYDKNPVQGRILESGRETERDREREKSKDRDKQAIAKFVEEIERVSKLNEALTQQLQEKERYITNMQRVYSEKLERQKENYLLQIKDLTKSEGQIKAYCSQLEDQIRKLREELSKKQAKLQEANNELEKQSQYFTKNLEFFTKKGEEFQDSWKVEEKEMQALYEKIDSQYLKQLQAQKKKIDDLELTLNQTHELMANEAKEKKLIQAELQQLKKGKKK